MYKINLNEEINKLRKDYKNMGYKLFVGTNVSFTSLVSIAESTWEGVFNLLYDMGEINVELFDKECYSNDEITGEEKDSTITWSDKEWKQAVIAYTSCDYFETASTYLKLKEIVY